MTGDRPDFPDGLFLSCPVRSRTVSPAGMSPGQLSSEREPADLFLNGGADVHLSDVYAFGRLFSGIYVSRRHIHPAILPHSGICSGTRCNYLRTRCFWRCLTINCLQLAQVRRSMSLRRPKNRRFLENMPLGGLQGRFCKTLGSQVFTSWPDSLRYRQTLPYPPFLPYRSILSFLSFLLFCHFPLFYHFSLPTSFALHS